MGDADPPHFTLWPRPAPQLVKASCKGAFEFKGECNRFMDPEIQSMTLEKHRTSGKMQPHFFDALVSVSSFRAIAGVDGPLRGQPFHC